MRDGRDYRDDGPQYESPPPAAQEEPDPGAAPGESIAELNEEAIPKGEGQEETDKLEPGDGDEHESLESIVQDLKRERGQEKPPSANG